ncbi:MAG: hypothetical protein ABIH24_11595 [Verrucomicrobiota bacterium]
MKKTYYRAIMLGAILLATASVLTAETTGQINYQARLLDAYGRRVNGTVALGFKFYDAITAGNLLWSETHASVAVADGIYAINLGSTTPIPASVFTQDSIYLELEIDGEIMSPRQLITSAGQALVARTVMGDDIFVNQTNGKVGIGTITPTEQLDVNGTIRITGFKLPTGATDKYVLMSDGDGTGQWRPVTAGIMETDPVFNAWSVSTYTPATDDLWTAIGSLNVSTGALNTAVNSLNASTGALNTAVNSLNASTGALNTAVNSLNASTGALNTAVGQRMFRAGDIMTGPLTNEFAYYGNGIGITNIPASGLILTNYVQRSGDSMTGELTISNNLAVSGNVTWQSGLQTIADNVTTIQVVQTFTKIGTADGSVWDFSGCTMQIAQGVTGQILIIQATNGWIRLNNGKGVTLAGDVSFSMSTNDTMQLVYDGSTWVELHRVDNNATAP